MSSRSLSRGLPSLRERWSVFGLVCRSPLCRRGLAELIDDECRTEVDVGVSGELDVDTTVGVKVGCNVDQGVVIANSSVFVTTDSLLSVKLGVGCIVVIVVGSTDV